MSNVKEYDKNTNTLYSTNREQWKNMATGEIAEIDSVKKRYYGAKQFWKIFLTDYLAVLGIFESKQLDVFIYILEKTDPHNNHFIGTYKEIQKACNTSSATVARIMKKLQEHKFITQKLKGLYVVNANLIMKGNEKKRRMLVEYFESNDPEDVPLSKTIKNREVQKKIIAGQTTLTDDIYHACYMCGEVVAVVKVDDNTNEVDGDAPIEVLKPYTKSEMSDEYKCNECMSKE